MRWDREELERARIMVDGGSRPGATGVIGVGYEGRDRDEFVQGLLREQVTLLVDVRLNPMSRKRGFGKTALRTALAEAGIGYEHMRELGNPKWNRAGFGGGPADLTTARGVYARSLGAPDAADRLDGIARAAARHRVAVMCFEADETRCHRDLVLTAVRARLDHVIPA